MKTSEMTQIAIISIVAIVMIYRLVKSGFLERLNSSAGLIRYNINSGNQTDLIYAPDYDPEWFSELSKKYSWVDFNDYDNKFWEYMYQLFDTLPKLANTSSEDALFAKCNRGQKVFWSVLAFTGDVDNGGVEQFFKNRPAFSVASLQAFKELNTEPLASDYEKCLNAFNNKENISNPANAIEEYFYKKEFKLELYKTVVEYIDEHIDQFVRK